MDFTFLDLRTEDGLAVVTMNRPPGNALSLDFVGELEAAVSRLAADDDVRCVLFRSALPKYFMVGADLKAMPPGVDLGDIDGSLPPREMMREILARMSGHMAGMTEKIQDLMNRVERMPKPTIAAIGGHALGGGLEFSLACDLRVMARGTGTIGLTEISLGLIPGAGGTQRLPRVVGRGRALEMIFLAERLSADEAVSAGLVHRAVEPADLEAEAMALAETLAGGATVAMACAKEALLVGEDRGIEEGLALERRGTRRLFDTEDLAEGIMAFNRKEKPRFSGR